MPRFTLFLLIVAACGKTDKTDNTGKTDKTDTNVKPVTTATTDTTNTGSSTSSTKTGAKAFGSPTGPGPHEGFDLAAIHKKLQGSWLVGGAAFSSIPNVWSLDGDTLTQVDAKGERTTSTFRLLAPCYFVEGAPDGSSGTYGHFALDGDTLYLGLGIAGVVAGDRTIGCMAVGMYVLDNGTCTRWTKKSFSKPGVDEWEKEPGDCTYADDKKTFTADDTNSKRKIYGVETLNVRGNVLLSLQMENNKAAKLASLDAAIAKQKEAIDKMTALTKTPTDLPFKSWGLASTAPAFAANAPVWAAAVTRDGRWDLRTFRYKSFDNDAVWVTGMDDAWAPSPFVHDATGTATAGTPALLSIGALMPHGRVTAMKGDKLEVKYWQFGKVAETTMEPQRVLAIGSGWVFGAPLAYKRGTSWVTAQLVLDGDTDVHVFIDRKVEKVAKADVRLIDLSKRFAKGAKIWAAPSSGMSLAFVEGSVLEVLGEGLGYTVKTADRKFDVSFDRAIAKL
ncbi:MAG: hypothetical protein ACKV2T_23670 [Kofleriaceae bacterium]